MLCSSVPRSFMSGLAVVALVGCQNKPPCGDLGGVDREDECCLCLSSTPLTKITYPATRGDLDTF